VIVKQETKQKRNKQKRNETKRDTTETGSSRCTKMYIRNVYKRTWREKYVISCIKLLISIYDIGKLVD